MERKKVKQLTNIEFERKLLMKVAAVCIEYLVVSHGKQWKDGTVEKSCRGLLDEVFYKIKSLRQIVRMQRSSSDPNNAETAEVMCKSLDGDFGWLKDIRSESEKLAKERGYVG